MQPEHDSAPAIMASGVDCIDTRLFTLEYDNATKRLSMLESDISRQASGDATVPVEAVVNMLAKGG
jgi:hypothetical protein